MRVWRGVAEGRVAGIISQQKGGTAPVWIKSVSLKTGLLSSFQAEGYPQRTGGAQEGEDAGELSDNHGKDGGGKSLIGRGEFIYIGRKTGVTGGGV